MHRFIVLFVLVSHLAALQATKPAWMEALTEASEWTLDNVVQPHVGDDLWRVVKEITLNATAVIPNAIAKPPYIDEAVVRPMSRYFIGYSVVMSVGILLIVLVPIGGLISCFVRCCCCKQKKDVAASKRSECCSNSCGLLLLLLIGAVTLGCIAIFGTVQQADSLMRDSDENAFQRLANTFDNIGEYVDNTLSEMKVAKNEIIQGFDELTTPVSDMAGKISKAIDAIVKPTVGPLDSDLKNLDETSEQLKNNLINITHLENFSKNANFLLQKSQKAIGEALQGCSSASCITIKNELSMLETTGNYSVYSITDNIIDLDSVVDKMILSLDVVKNGVKDVDNIILEAVDKEIDSINNELNDAKTKVNDYFSDVVKKVDTSMFEKYSDEIVSASPQNNSITNDVWTYWKIVIWSTESLMVTICIVYFIGFLHAVCCSKAKLSGDCCCTIKAGAIFMTLGSTISILFYWIFAIIALIFFMNGGLLHTVLCRQLSTINDSRLVDVVSDVINDKVPTSDFTVNIGLTYMKCSQNQTLYSALDLRFDISSSLIDGDVEKILNEFRKMPINIPQLDFKVTEMRALMKQLNTTITEVIVKVERILGDLSNEFIPTDVKAMLSTLYEIASAEFPSPELQVANEELRNTYSVYIEPAELHIKSLSTMFENTKLKLNWVNFDYTNDEFEKIQDKINNDTEDIISKHKNSAAEMISALIEDMVDSVNVDLRENIGHCYPIYSSVNRVRNILCDDVTPILNVIWFGFVWCIICLIVMLFVACKLNTLYTCAYYRSIRKAPYTAWVNGSFVNDRNVYQSVYPLEALAAMKDTRPPAYSPDHLVEINNLVL